MQTEEYQRIDDVLKETSPKLTKGLYISADGSYVHSAEKDSKSFEDKFGVVYRYLSAYLKEQGISLKQKILLKLLW